MMMGKGRRQRFNSKKRCSCFESESKSHDHAKNNITKQKSNNKSCKVISKLLLPEDLVLDILSRVPPKCLLNSARYVCKPWATAIRSSYFAHLYYTRSKPGLYVENCTSKRYSYFLDIKDNMNGRFEKTVLGTPSRMGDLISSRAGILLLLRQRLNTVAGPKKIHFGYNVKTRQLTKIGGIAVGDFEVWLHTHSLVRLPGAPT